MIQIFPDQKSAQHLYALFVCIVFVLVFVGIAELISPSSVKKNSEPIIAEVLPVVVIQPTSTEPYRFDPKSRGPASTTPQFVLLSFDGSKSIEMWRETVDFAESMNANGAPLHFTYFINSAYFLAFENRGKYLPLYGKPGDSMIGFAESIQSINERVKGLNRAVELGHEIGSHTAGHWDGKNWSVNDWCKEHNLFIDLLFNFENNNSQFKFSEPIKLRKNQIRGFRAPELSKNNNMYEALSKDGFSYDSSEVAIRDAWPYRDSNRIWHVPISTIYFPLMQKNIIAVDYSVWINQTAGKNVLWKNTPEWQIQLDGMVSGYLSHFNQNYFSNRAPMVIDNHFSNWNDGLYWEATKEFAKKVCGMPHVRCSTFSDLVGYMEKGSVLEYN